MGRPPIGKVAMTDAERMRRYRLKHRADKPVTKVTKQNTGRLEARIRELEAQLTRERKRRAAAEAKLAKKAGNP
jgi:hypothetical protein